MKNHQILNSEPQILSLSTNPEINFILDAMDPFSCTLEQLEEKIFHMGKDFGFEHGYLLGVLMCRTQLIACSLEVTQ
jgi:hypothetical protein